MISLLKQFSFLSLLVFLGSFAPVAKEPVPAPITPQEALQRLLAGNERFVRGRSIHPNQTAA